MKEYNSIFNHALAPITPGPSSSNTCGPVRIGLVCQELLGSVPARAVVEYASTGAFVTTLYGMKSDVAFTNGLLGREQNDPAFNRAYEDARIHGMEITFREVDDLTVGGPETVRVRMATADGEELAVIGESLGGGAFKIHYIDDCPIDIHGTHYELILFLKEANQKAAEVLTATLAAQVPNLNDSYCVTGQGGSIIDLRAPADYAPELLEHVAAMPEVKHVRVIPPIHPVIADVSRKPPFQSPEEMIAYCEAQNCSPAQAAIDYEMAISGWDADKVRAYGDMLLDIMHASRAGGFDPELHFDGIMTPKGSVLKGKVGTGRQPSLGLLNAAIPSALGIMEFSNATGKIVCVPTGGSSGIVPGLLLSAAEYLQVSEDALYEALMTSGIIGVLMMVDGNEFSGGAHGCQAEVACGTAMAAAGLVQMMGGTAKQACDAAAMSLQSFLGLICDPVAGLVQVPCLARNMAAVSVAATAAEVVCAGFDVVISLDEMSRIMVRVGTKITGLLGNCCDGCCITPTGKRLTEEYNAHLCACKHT